MGMRRGYVLDPEGAETAALAFLGGLEGARVLEIGCGDGRLTYRYAPWTRSVFAIDPEEEAIASARTDLPATLESRVRFDVGDAVELEQPPAAFDAIFLSHSL